MLSTCILLSNRICFRLYIYCKSFTYQTQREIVNHPLIFLFSYSIDPGEYDPGVGCIIRAVAGSVSRDDIIVNRVDSLADIAVLEETEELISNVISVTSEKDISVSFALALRYMSV